MVEHASGGSGGGGRNEGEAAPAPFRRIHAHVPLAALRKKMGLFLDRRLNPEIYFSHRALALFSDGELAALASTLDRAGLRTTIHGPFHDLSPGAVDPAFRTLTVRRMGEALRSAFHFSPECIVFHPGYDPLRFAEFRDAWLRNSLRTWKSLLPLAEELPGTWILIENIFEREPSTLTDLLGSLPSPPFGFCLDVGHFRLFSDVPLDVWMEALGARLREVHIHDNLGTRDDHLPPGRGDFDFRGLFRHLEGLEEKAIGTIESHSEKDLLESLDWLKGGRGLSA